MELTDWRAKPAVPFAGKFRIIDFSLSNCVNSGIRRIGILTQYKAHSLINHIQRGWGFMRAELNEFVELLPAQQRVEGESWYRGTADAIYQNIDIIRHHRPTHVLVLAGDHVYKMDYARMLEDHLRTRADLTVGCLEIPAGEGSGFGIIERDTEGWVRRFVEKPAHVPEIPGKPGRALASMGIYIFDWDFLCRELERDAGTLQSSHDFGKDLIPFLVGTARCYAHDVAETYWRDVGTVDAYWEANIDLTTVTPSLNLYDTTWPIFTFQEQYPPAKFVFDSEGRRGIAVDSLVSGGCVISGSRVQGSLLFSNVRVHSYSRIEGAVVLPDVEIGRHCRLDRVVIDRGCRIPPGTVVGADAQADARRFRRTDKGVVLITRKMLAELGAQQQW